MYRIAIDGGASTGKSTVSNMLSEKLGITYINTGLTYRLIALYAMKNNLLGKWDKLINILSTKNIDYDGVDIIMDDEFERDNLKSAEVGANASIVAAIPVVNSFAASIWKRIAERPNILLEGRDIGTQIMPQAENKFFLIVSDEVAADRRYKEHISRGEKVSYEEILSAIKERNVRDVDREVSPLKAAEDAIIIDTSERNPKEIVEFIISKLK